jgi:hypothetical protein
MVVLHNRLRRILVKEIHPISRLLLGRRIVIFAQQVQILFLPSLGCCLVAHLVFKYFLLLRWLLLFLLRWKMPNLLLGILCTFLLTFILFKSSVKSLLLKPIVFLLLFLSFFLLSLPILHLLPQVLCVLEFLLFLSLCLIIVLVERLPPSKPGARILSLYIPRRAFDRLRYVLRSIFELLLLLMLCRLVGRLLTWPSL